MKTARIKVENNKTHIDILSSHASKKKMATSTNSRKLLSVTKRDKNILVHTNRNKIWFTELWEKRNDENFGESFKEDFRIYPNKFVDGVNLVEGNISKEDTKLYKAIAVEKRVAIAL